MNIKDIVFILLPVLLWPVSFILLKSVFIYALLVSTAVLALVSLRWYKRSIPWKKVKSSAYVVLAGIIGAAVLYLIFYLGNYAVALIGIDKLVGNVYQMIYGAVPKIPLMVVLVFIGIFEEIYWRGALQSYVRKNSKFFGHFPWIATTIFYALVHIAALNPILVVAAFFVGLVTSLVAEKYGILSSMLTHIVWIELIVVFLPVIIK